MLHLIYIFAFTILAFLAIGNLIRNIMVLGAESTKAPRQKLPQPGQFTPNTASASGSSNNVRSVSHPELLDDSGNIVNEPYLVMRSMTVEDARERLDALYKSSPGYNGDEAPREE